VIIRQLLFCITVCFSLATLATPYPIVFDTPPFSGSLVFRPNDSRAHISIVMLHGSEGGSARSTNAEASLLAAQGFVVLSLCYFDCGRGLTGPRATLKNMEATIVLDAVKWLREQPQSNSKVVVYGLSRGAELAMVTGSLDAGKRMPDALIAHSPSDTFNGPINWDWYEPACWICKTATCNATSPDSDYRWNPSCGPDDPTTIDRSKSAWLVNGASVSSGTRIAIEKFKGPILITVGEKDEIWPVDQTRRIEATLKTVGRPAEVYYFPGAGHKFNGADEIRRRELVLDFLTRVR
jgi:dienelactone hydrolase